MRQQHMILKGSNTVQEGVQSRKEMHIDGQYVTVSIYAIVY